MNITLRFVGYRSVTSGAIVIGEGGGWASHAETLTPDGKLLGSVAPDGVQARARDYDKGQFARELFVTLRPRSSFCASASTPEKMAEVFYEFAHSQIGRPYDFEAIAGIALEQDWHDDSKWFCSELMAAGLERCGYFPRLYVPSWHVSPRDLLLAISGREYVEDLPRAAVAE